MLFSFFFFLAAHGTGICDTEAGTLIFQVDSLAALFVGTRALCHSRLVAEGDQGEGVSFFGAL